MAGALPGCVGEIGGASGAGGAGSGDPNAGTGGTAGGTGGSKPLGHDRPAVIAACEAKGGDLDVGLTKLRRLTRDQLNNTLRDLSSGLFGVEENWAQTLAPDELVGPFHSNATAPITELLVQQHQELAARAARAVESGERLGLSCDLAADAGTTCATEFVESFGLRAYRRPLAPDEVSALVGLYGLGQQRGGAAGGLRLLLEAMLQAPSFLYHADTGETGLPTAEPVKVSAYGLASRLSYFLWNSMPDDALFELAREGMLGEPAVLDEQVDRMLSDPKAEATIALFHRQWLGVGDLREQEKDAELHPTFGPELASAMLEEQARFTREVILNGDARLSTLLTASYSYPSAELLPLYGMTAPEGFQPGDRVSFPEGQRAGLLTQAAFLAKHAKRAETSPVHRGLWIRENVLCEPILPPPVNVNTTLPPAQGDRVTMRERLVQHQADPVCASCHSMMDPIGLGFEHFDAVGAYRTTEAGGPVSGAGEIVSRDVELAGSFEGAVELAGKLASSESVADCVARQWFRFALGRTESADDACSMRSLVETFDGTGRDVRALMRQIVKSEAFQNVQSTVEE